MSALFTGTGLSKSYGVQRALDRVDFELAAGEVKGLVGANGAGKSTLLKILAGALAPDEGELTLDGKPLRLTSLRDASRQGIALVSQELNLFPALSIRENLSIIGTDTRLDSAEAVLADLGLSVPLNKTLGDLSLGDRQLVEIARALLQKPRVLILDEPTSALHKREKERLLQVVKRLKASGVAIIYVSHFLEEVLEIADGLLVLRDGKRVTTEFALSKERLGDVVFAMLGQKSAEIGAASHKPRTDAENNAAVLRITDLEGPSQLRIPSLTVRSGEVVGVAGLAGAGVEELFAILFGRVRPRRGTIVLPSGAGVPRSIAEAVAARVAYIPADRKRLGLMIQKSVAENVCSVRSLVVGKDGFFLRRNALEALSRARCTTLGVKAASMRMPAGALSGGNQQKLVFGKWLEADPMLVLLDDPTRGVDIGAKREMHRIVRELADQGKIVLIHSSDPMELVSLADRVHVFVEGYLRAELTGAALTEHNLVSAMNTNTSSAPHIESALTA